MSRGDDCQCVAMQRCGRTLLEYLEAMTSWLLGCVLGGPNFVKHLSSVFRDRKNGKSITSSKVLGGPWSY